MFYVHIYMWYRLFPNIMTVCIALVVVTTYVRSESAYGWPE